MGRALGRLPLVVLILGLAGLLMLVPALQAAMVRQFPLARAFFYSACLVGVGTVILGLATALMRPRDTGRNHLAAVAGVYLLLPAVLALPLLPQEGGALGLGAAWFEMLSAFTTTGATLYAPADLPGPVHLWRGLVGWAGGYFTVVAALAVMAPLTLGGMELITGRTPGRGARGAGQVARVASLRARVLRYGWGLFPAYAGLTGLLWLGLMIAGEEPLTGAIHAMSTLSTSGITPVAGGVAGARSGVAGEVLVFAFLALALSRRPLLRALGPDVNRPRGLDAEGVTAAVILGATAAVLALRLLWGAGLQGRLGEFGAMAEAIWGALFAAMSFLTTTGFQAQGWRVGADWSGLVPAGAVLWGLAIVGGGIATTAGGVKLLRVAALFRHTTRELDRVIYPSLVPAMPQGERRLREEATRAAWVFFTLFALSIAVVTAALTLVGTSFEAALVQTLAALTATGPLVDQVPGLGGDWADSGGAARVVLGGAMILGRMEVLAVLALVLPESWRL